MITKEILESHPVSVLKKEISKTNIKGYSKMKKSGIVSLMLKPEHSKRFSHIKKAETKGKKEAPKKEAPKKESASKKNTEKEVKKIKEELDKIRNRVYTEQFNLKQLRQKIKSKEDIKKINKEIEDIQKEANKKQSDLKKYDNEKKFNFLRPILLEILFDKERYERRLISIVRNLSKISRTL